jgi:hypothetical protein
MIRLRPTLQTLVLVIAAFALSAPAIAVQSPAVAKPVAATAISRSEQDAVKDVTERDIRDVTIELAAPGMEGRATGAPGGERAAAAIAEHLSKAGLKPCGDNNTYLQQVPFVARTIAAETTLEVNGTRLVFGKDYVIAPPFPDEVKRIEGEAVIAGYGVVSEELKRDDYAGIDVKGKVVLLFAGRPTGVDEKVWAKASNQMAVFSNIISKGAAAVVIVGFSSGGRPFSAVADYLSRRSVALAGAPGMPFPLPPIALAGPEGAKSLFAAAGANYDEVAARAAAGEPVSKSLGATVKFVASVERKEVKGSNVAAVLPGSDPVLSKQAVVFTAHYDAYGLAADGRAYAGAADNALGVAQMLAIAKAAAKLKTRPKRSIVFLAVCGEEHGLLGAKYWAEHPTWPLADIAANINFDGIGTEIYGPVERVVGFGGEFSSLGPMLDAVAPAFGARVVPDPMPEEKAFLRSDHYEFVKKGIPALMLLGAPGGDEQQWISRARTWLETDYHQVTDVVGDNWNWGGARTTASIGLVVALRVANAADVPTWNPDSKWQRAAPKPAA